MLPVINPTAIVIYITIVFVLLTQHTIVNKLDCMVKNLFGGADKTFST